MAYNRASRKASNLLILHITPKQRFLLIDIPAKAVKINAILFILYRNCTLMRDIVFLLNVKTDHRGQVIFYRQWI